MPEDDSPISEYHLWRDEEAEYKNLLEQIKNPFVICCLGRWLVIELVFCPTKRYDASIYLYIELYLHTLHYIFISFLSLVFLFIHMLYAVWFATTAATVAVAATTSTMSLTLMCARVCVLCKMLVFDLVFTFSHDRHTKAAWFINCCWIFNTCHNAPRKIWINKTKCRLHIVHCRLSKSILNGIFFEMFLLLTTFCMYMFIVFLFMLFYSDAYLCYLKSSSIWKIKKKINRNESTKTTASNHLITHTRTHRKFRANQILTTSNR